MIIFKIFRLALSLSLIRSLGTFEPKYSRSCNTDACPTNGKLQLIPAYSDDQNPTSGLLTLYVNGTYRSLCAPKLSEEMAAKLGQIACNTLKLGSFKRATRFDESDLSFAEYRNNSLLEQREMQQRQPWQISCGSTPVDQINSMEDIFNKCQAYQFRPTGCR